jgi:phosphoesterase RecJ-like protein
MNYEIKKQILDKIKEYDRIMLFRHVRPDGDCMGATKGMKRILQLSFPQKQILLIDSELPQYLAFMGPDDEPVDEALYADALGIVLDTASEARISNKNYKLCKEVIKIDHHIPLEHYGKINWEEEHRSSACEMVVDFYETFKDELTIDSEAATHLYTGLVTDSGRYKYSGVNGDTLRCGATLLDVGVDTDTLFARLYLEAFEYLKFKAHVYNRMQITENGVAYLYVDCAMQEQFGLTKEMASATVGCLDAIRGCICWMVFIENGDEEQSIRVRLRSRFVHINSVAEKYRGGGHACASGATVYGQAEVDALLRETDALVKEYKETHEGWL